MATERQIAANRRNAQKSTGPRSAAGQKTSSQNALRHGLNSRISSIDFEKQIENLARQFAGHAEDRINLADAHVAAEADLELQRIRQIKVAMYERINAYGDFDSTKLFQSDKEEIRWMKANIQWLAGRGPLKLPWPAAIDPLATMPKEEPHRSAEAARRLLPELVRLLPYETRAAGRRDRAIRRMMLGHKSR
jgi:hypothetical protein